MDRITKRFVRFMAPGAFVAEDWSRPVETLDPNAVQWPDNAYCFSLHERIDVMDGPEVFTGPAKKVGPTYFHPDSVVESLEQVRANPKATRTLIANMEGNRWSHIVWSRWGNWPQPFDPAQDVVLKAGAAWKEAQ